MRRKSAAQNVTDEAEACPAAAPRWYALWLMANSEFVVEDALRGYGIESFLPTWDDKTQWSDRKKVIRRPLFPGYIFARCDDGPRREILRIAGVLEVLPKSLNPQPVDSAEIENLKRALAARLPAIPCPYMSGQEVLIESGPLAGVKGIVERTKNGTLVIIRIEMLQRAVAVTLDAADVVRAAA